MSGPEIKEVVSKKRRRNLLAKHMLDRDSPYKEKVQNPKKNGKYKREKIRLDNLDDYIEDD